MALSDQELLASGVDPAAVATLAADRPAYEARQAKDALDKIAPVISEEEATAGLDKIAPVISEEEAVNTQLDSIAPKVSPLSLFSDEVLIADKSFDPKEHYIQQGGAANFDAKTLLRLGKIRKGQEATRSHVGTAVEQVKHIIPAVPKLIAGVGKGIAAGIHAATIAPLVEIFGPKGLAEEYGKLSEQQAAESLHGAVAEAAGLVKGGRTLGKKIARGTGLSKSWGEMSDAEALQVLIDEGEREREVRNMAAGDIPALSPTREALAEQGTPVRPEKVQEASERGLVGWLGFGTGIKLGGAAVKAGARGAIRAAVPAIGKAEQVTAAGKALQTARAAETAAGESATSALQRAAETATTVGEDVVVSAQAGAARSAWEAAQQAVTAAESALTEAASAARTARGAGLLSAAEKASQLQALRAARETALKAFQAGPKNAEREAALKAAQDSFKTAEEAVGQSNLAKALDGISRAKDTVSTFSETAVQNVLGRPVQAAGAVIEGAGKAVSAIPRGYAALGSIGGLFVSPAAALTGIAGRLAAPAVAKAGAAVKGFGKAVSEGTARRTLDLLGAAKDVTTTALSQYPLDYAFSIGLSDTEQEARVAPPISTALGVLPGAGRGLRRITTSELVTPRGVPTRKISSPAYGENTTLDKAHDAAIKVSGEKTVAQINWIRELARKFGGRVYLMPDTQSFESVLSETWKQQTGTEAPLAEVKQIANQQGFIWGNFRAADGEIQPTVFIKNPEVAVHEIGHIMEKVLPESINARLDEQIMNRLSPENIEQAGSYYVNRLLGQPKNTPVNWREVLTQKNPDLSPEQYLAREMRAENLAVLLRNRGEAFASSPGVYRWLVQVIAKISDASGVPLSYSEDLGFPVFGDVMTAGERAGREFLGDEAAQELIKARETRLQKPTIEPRVPRGTAPVTGEQRQAESAKITQQADETAVRNPQTAEILRKIASAVASGTGLKVDYRAAAGEPGGAGAARSTRRKEIEAFRNVPESVRPLFEKLNFPDRVELTKNKGLQILGWSPENYAANAQKMAEFILNMQAKLPEAANWSPYELDAKTKSFTPEGWKQLYDDAQTFVKNQQAGGTGSGRPLQVPPEAAAAGAAVPELRPGSLAPLNQHAADFHNLLFNIMLPETVRVSRKGGTPGNIVAQDIARANEPLVGPRVTEPGRPRGVSKETGEVQEFPGFPGRRIQEVNPLRGEMERAAQQTKISFPELIEVSQRLNLEHVADVTLAPEAPPIRGVTDTLRAGFAPAKLPEAFGEVKTAKEISERVKSLPPEEYARAVTPFEGKYGGGQTGLSFELGAQVRDAADIATYAEAMRGLDADMEAARARKDFDSMLSIPVKKQFFRELLETATDGTAAEYIRKKYDPDYEAPFPKVQFIAKTPSGKDFEGRGYNFRTSGAPGFRTLTVSRDGKEVGAISASSTSGDVRQVVVADAHLDKSERGRGLGEALYREMLTQLQTDGVKQVSGQVIAPEPLALREKIFGKGSTEVDINFEPATLQHALKEAGEVKAGGTAAVIEARNEIRPGMQFAPSKNPEAIKEAAIRFPNGKMLTAPHHGAVELKAGSTIPRDSEYGFVTNSGEFLTRKEAFERATEIGQIDPNDIPEEAEGQLESFEFQEARQFSPAEISPAELTEQLSSEKGYVYHATNLDNLLEIAKSKKLLPHTPGYGTDQSVWPDGGAEKRSYFSSRAGIVWMFAPEDGTPVVIRTKDAPDFRTESTGDKYSRKALASSRLEFLATDGNWHPVDKLFKKRTSPERPVSPAGEKPSSDETEKMIQPRY